MKPYKISFLFVYLFVVCQISAQAQYEYLNPLAEGWPVLDIHVLDNNVAFFLYRDGLYKTDDGGENWTKVRSTAYPDNYLKMGFKDDVGLIAGKNGKSLLSIDGGDTWADLTLPTTDDINSIQILNEDSLMAGSSQSIYLSSDGGTSWVRRNIPINEAQETFFTSFLTAHSVGISDYILKTTDGGISWDSTTSSSGRHNTIYFVDDNKGFAASSGSEVYKTNDAGITWTEITNRFLQIHAIKFADANTGYMSGRFGALYKTINGGSSWTTIPTQPTSQALGDDLYAIGFLDADRGFVGGLKGRITKTTDGGMTWKDYSPYYYGFRNVIFPTAETGFALAYTSMYITKDGGDSWELFSDQYSAKHAQIFHPDSILIAGGRNTYRTDDGGMTWTQTPTPEIPSFVESMHFIDRDTGFVSGDQNGLTRFFAVTHDGGYTWNNPVPFPRLSFDHLYFINSKIGFAIGVGQLYKTLDGGLTWNQDTILTDNKYNDLSFPTDSVGYVIEDYGHVFKTEDQGASWDTFTVHNDPLLTMHFVDEYNGYVCPKSGNPSRYYVTHDGGETWEARNLPRRVSATTVAPDGDIFFVGDEGLIARDKLVWWTTSIYEGGELSTKIKLYPNPSRGKIYVERSSNNALQIRVMDLQGRLVYQHVDFDQPFFELDSQLNGLFVIIINDGAKQYSGKILILPSL